MAPFPRPRNQQQRQQKPQQPQQVQTSSSWLTIRWIRKLGMTIACFFVGVHITSFLLLIKHLPSPATGNGNGNGDVHSSFRQKTAGNEVAVGEKERKRGPIGEHVRQAHERLVKATTRLEESVGKKATTALKSCWTYDISNTKMNPQTIQRVLKDQCHPKTHGAKVGISVYNSLDVPRYWCDKQIPSQSVVAFDGIDKCESINSLTSIGHHSPSSSSLSSSTSLSVLDLPLGRVYPTDPTTHPNENSKLGPMVISPRPINNQDRQTVLNNLRDIPCNIPCKKPNQRGKPLISFWEILDTDWKVTYSMEGPQYYPTLKIKPQSYKQNNFYATTSFKSEIPLPYFSWAEYNIQQPPVQYDRVIHGASFIARNCASVNRREQLVNTLRKYIRVDSLSQCLHNAEPPNGLSMSNKGELMAQYLFHFAFENQCEDDYITEKLWGTLQSGTLGVYFGAPNVRDHLPHPSSVIVAQDFGTHDELGKYLREVMQNKTLYESHHEWRHEPTLSRHFVEKFDFTHVHSECRMCRWAYAKKYGLRFDHYKQSVEENMISRVVCVVSTENDGGDGGGGVDDHDGGGLMASPFRERYMDLEGRSDGGDIVSTKRLGSTVISSSGSIDKGMGKGDVSSSCQEGTSPGKLSPAIILGEGEYNIQRTIIEHDGVIDLIYTESNGHMEQLPPFPIVLRMETSITNTNGLYFVGVKVGKEKMQKTTPTATTTRNGDLLQPLRDNDGPGVTSLSIQDGTSRITVVTDFVTRMTSPNMGVIDVVIDFNKNGDGDGGEVGTGKSDAVPIRGKPKTIRVISEDVNELHYDENDATPSYFGGLMEKDLANPLEMFYVA